MRTLLRNISTELYFQGPDEWTRDPRKALNFGSIDRALRFVETWKLDNLELAFAFKDDNSVTLVPLEKIAVPFAHS